MVLRRAKPQLSKTTHQENDENGPPEICHRKSIEPVDHWVFLDEIEAPMWADLTLEAKSTYQEKDNEWFNVPHPFHQCSSRQLISAFSHTGEGCKISDIGKEEPSSPKLPPSVSRLRGKPYKSKEWRQNNCRVTANKQHPIKNLSSKSTWTNAGTGKEIKLKSSYGSSKPQSGLEAGSVCESSLTETRSKLESDFGDPKFCSNSMAIKEGESSSTSTTTAESSLSGAARSKFYKPISSFGDSKLYSISLAIKTSENNSVSIEQHRQKSVEVSTHLFAHKGGFLSSLKVGLRKSCVTRQASRILINGGRQAEGHKSSSSKSSVGSSSYPGYEVEKQTLAVAQNRERTPDSKNAIIMPHALKQKVKVPDICKDPHFQIFDRSSGSKCRGENIASKPTNWGTAKSKVHSQSVHSKGLVPRNVNKQDPLLADTKTKDKVVGVGWSKRLAGGGTENAIGRLDGSQKSSMREVSGGIVMKRNVSQKSNRRKLTGPKEKYKVGTEGTKSTNMTQKVFLSVR